MDCKNCLAAVALYLYGEMPDGERREFDRHVSSCAACRASLAEATAAVAFLRGHPPRFSTEELSALRVRVLSETSRIVPAPRPAVLRGFFSALLAGPAFRFASVAAALVAAVWLLLPRPPEDSADTEVAGVLAMAEDIEEESEEVAEVCREIDALNSAFPAAPADSGAFLNQRPAVSAV